MHTHHIGLLGGSFNPPHFAHLALAQAALIQLHLARVDLMPAGQPWQKTHLLNTQQFASPTHRLAMCQLAIANQTGLGIEPCETMRSGNTYTVDTLAFLRAKHPNTKYTLIIGADQANHLDTWHHWQELLKLCRLAVVARAGEIIQLPPAVITLQPKIDTLLMPTMLISSTKIRQAITTGQSIIELVPPAIAGYIAKHALYQL